MNKIKLTLFITLSIIFASCQKNSDFNTENLIGSWEVAKWEVLSTGELRTNKMDMRFDNDESYQIDYGGEVEEGKYWLASEFLHTIENNQSEKKVKIIELSVDTFKIQMNRGGELENVLLIKKKG